MKKTKIIVVLPAYNAEKTLKRTFNDIPKNTIDEVILVDDASKDKTVELARKLGIKTFVHKRNLGYGANQKTCYKYALKMGADIIIMLHPDYQYDSKKIGQLIDPIKKGYFDIMLGTRIEGISKNLKTGMPLYKYIANIFLTNLNNKILGTHMGEYHTGYRAYSSEVLQRINFNKFSNGHLFDLEIIIEAVKNNFRIGDVFIKGRYLPESSSMGALESIAYGLRNIIYLVNFIAKKN